MQPLSSADLKILRERLLAEKEDLLHESHSVLDALKQPDAVSEDDQATVVHEQFLALHIGRHEYQKLKKIDAALDRLAAGDFGTCNACDQPIARRRLLAIPWADLCVTCQEQFQDQVTEETETVVAA